MYVLTNGKLILPDQIAEGMSIVMKRDRIEALIPDTDLDTYRDLYQIVDAKGAYISPGFIDTHSDYIEKIVSPRPSTLMDFKLAIKETERLLMTHGITMMFHSLSFYNDDLFSKSLIRQPKNAALMMNLIHDIHNEKHLIRHRIHARYEIDNLDMVEMILDYVREGKIKYLSIMDHTPGQGQYSNLDIYRKTLLGYGTVSEDNVESVIDKRQKTEKLSLKTIKYMVDVAHQAGIAVASHDDDSLEKLHLMHELGIDISEFPITLEVAKKARQLGMETVGGAPNILLGGSHSGNLSVAEAIQEEAMTMLCSDYYPSGLVNAIFKMHFDYGRPLTEMVNTLTLNPAKALKLDDYGSLEVGKKADIITICLDENNYPSVTSMFVGGVPVFQTQYRQGGKPV